MLESIKADRNLSFSNWRYRLLHWFFAANPANVDEAVGRHDIPRMFYTHYCPLFHFTNLLAIFLPLIITGKILYYVICKIILLVSYLYDKFGSYLLTRVSKAEAKKEHKEKKTPSNLKAQKKLLFIIIENNLDEEFNDIWAILKSAVRDKEQELELTREVAEEIWVKNKDPLLQAKKVREEKARIRRERIVFWVNFSQVFIKGFLNVFYIGLTALVAYLLWLTRGFFGWLFTSIFWGVATFDVLATFLWFILLSLKTALVLTILFTIAYLLQEKFKKFFDFVGNIFSIMSGACVDLFNHIVDKVVDFRDFIGVFYEENCPAIHIVSADTDTEGGNE